MPITDEMREKIKPATADLCNSGKGVYGGSISAAAFLESFIEKGTKWAHLDIAGPACMDYEKVPLNVYGTGFGTSTLLKLIKG